LIVREASFTKDDNIKRWT